MSQVTNFIKLDFNRSNDITIPTIEWDQGSRFVRVQLQNNNQNVDITGSQVVITVIRNDLEEIIESCNILDAKEGIIEFEISKSMVARQGDILCQLKLSDNDSLLSSQLFKISVNNTLMVSLEESRSEMNVLIHALGEVQNIDNRFAQTNAQLSERALQSDLEAERERINNLTKLGEGSTTGDAELIDARISAKGFIYPNLGSHIRDLERGLCLNDGAISVEKLSEDIIKIEKSQNILNVKDWVKYNISSSGVPSPNDSNYAYKIKIKNGKRYGLFREQSNGQGFIAWQPRISITDINNNVLDYYIGTTNDITISNSSAYYMWVWNSAFTETEYTNLKCMVLEGFMGNNPTNYITYYKRYILKIDNKNLWRNKNIVFYGDSITAQGNYVSGVTDNTTGYGYYAQLEHKFNAIYRGVGGQAFKRNSNTFYCNSDGSYAGRYGSGGLTVPPTGTTTHLGYFSSWDRITAMIPESIRQNIDMVVINGGHNDFESVEDVPTDGVITASEPKWEVNSEKDSKWKSSSYYNGGDYDIDTFTGAIASCIMKWQIWCPNAIIVIATPFPRWDMDTMQQMKVNGLTFRQLCEIEIATANYMQTPVMDLNGSCGINVTNYHNATQSDNIHPNEYGRKIYGRSLIGEFYRIVPKVEVLSNNKQY